MLCLIYVASSKALFSIFAEIIHIFVMAKVVTTWCRILQLLTTTTFALYVQSNHKILAKKIYTSAYETKELQHVTLSMSRKLLCVWGAATTSGGGQDSELYSIHAETWEFRMTFVMAKSLASEEIVLPMEEAVSSMPAAGRWWGQMIVFDSQHQSLWLIQLIRQGSRLFSSLMGWNWAQLVSLTRTLQLWRNQVTSLSTSLLKSLSCVKFSIKFYITTLKLFNNCIHAQINGHN